MLSCAVLQAGMVEVPVVAPKGTVLYFSGVLVHRGSPIKAKGASRHVLANHYVPGSFDGAGPHNMDYAPKIWP